MLLCLSCLLGKKKKKKTSTGLNRAIGTKPVTHLLLGCLWPIEKWVASMSKKDKMADESPRGRCVSYFPCSVTDFWGERVLAFLPWIQRHPPGDEVAMNFPFIESRNECFFIVCTQFWSSYKLSVENIRPLQPKKRVVWASYLKYISIKSLKQGLAM